jgi:cytochrome c oxidase assembly protein subunit 15
VQSGLVDDPHVSQFRLTAHLGLAVLIFGVMLWTALSLLYPQRERRVAAHGTLRLQALGTMLLVYVMILTGGLVAGTHAGLAYNTFPSMNGHVIPPEVLALEPGWRNFFWNIATVQLDHRVVAWLLAVAIPALWWRLARNHLAPARARVGSRFLLAMLAVQIALGISTLLLRVPLPLAALHQAGAVMVFALAINVAHALR